MRLFTTNSNCIKFYTQVYIVAKLRLVALSPVGSSVLLFTYSTLLNSRNSMISCSWELSIKLFRNTVMETLMGTLASLMFLSNCTRKRTKLIFAELKCQEIVRLFVGNNFGLTNLSRSLSLIHARISMLLLSRSYWSSFPRLLSYRSSRCTSIARRRSSLVSLLQATTCSFWITMLNSFYGGEYSLRLL